MWIGRVDEKKNSGATSQKRKAVGKAELFSNGVGDQVSEYLSKGVKGAKMVTRNS